LTIYDSNVKDISKSYISYIFVNGIMLPIIEEQIRYYIDLMVRPIDSDYTIEFNKEADQWRISIFLKNQPNSILIGDKGDVLAALQHIVRTLVHKKVPEDKTHFIIDIGTYRKSREEALSTRIPEIIHESVLSQGSTLLVTGLSSYERLLVHRCLSDINGIQSTSVGNSTNRKLLIMPTSDIGSTGIDKAIILDFTKLG
jgi:spoIIIJ-associated protein